MLAFSAGIHKMLDQGRPGSDCFNKSSLIQVFTVCLGLFSRQLYCVQNVFIEKKNELESCLNLLIGGLRDII